MTAVNNDRADRWGKGWGKLLDGVEDKKAFVASLDDDELDQLIWWLWKLGKVVKDDILGRQNKRSVQDLAREFAENTEPS